MPSTPAFRRRTIAVLAAALAAALLTAVAAAQSTTDPRVGLAHGLENPGVAALGVELRAHRNKPAGFFDPANPGSFAFVNSDLAFEGDHAFIGNFNGFQIYDIANPANPTLVTAVICPGGQGEVSAYGDLLFMSVEESRARVDCGTNPQVGTRFQGVRVFDISDVANPVQVAAVQTCRGSHTHTLLQDPDEPNTLYVYVSGTGNPRPATTMAGCNNNPANGENPSRWRIEVIRVPLAAPETAAIVNEPRLFTDPVTGRIDGLQNTVPTPQHPSGINWSPTPTTDSCHDLTTYPAIGLAAGACEGNGLLIDISDPANPVRIDEVSDPNWAYWHGATFSNDGNTVVFTDEWGGGTAARCRATDQPQWGGNAIYDIVDGQLVFRSYYKLPAPQSLQENCVSHLPSLIPVPGRDVMTQAWYQGGLSVIDFTDSANPKEIAYYDRGPISNTSLVLGGLWSTYYYNGSIYGSEIARGFDVWRLTPTADLSQNEIDAAAEVQLAQLTPQHQPRLVNAPSFAVVRSYRDQLVRAQAIPAQTLAQVDTFVDRAEAFRARGKDAAAKALLNALANQDRLAGPEFAALRTALRELANLIEVAEPEATTTAVRAEVAELAQSDNRRLADKADDVRDKLTVALAELAKTPPDGAAALGTLEGAAGDLQALVRDRLLTAAEGAALMDPLAEAGTVLAERAIADAIARGGNARKIADAERALAAGDTRLAAGRFKDALARYKDAYATAKGA